MGSSGKRKSKDAMGGIGGWSWWLDAVARVAQDVRVEQCESSIHARSACCEMVCGIGVSGP